MLWLLLSFFPLIIIYLPRTTSFILHTPLQPYKLSQPKSSPLFQQSTSTSTSTFDNFDYLSHWYPVIWERDVPDQKPVKVTIFDVDYVLTKLSTGEVLALEDRCPHKSAALSEGRVTSCGNFQCAYHGWSFDGKTGSCVEIPQTVTTDDIWKSSVGGKRSNARAVPAQISQGMIWLFPGGGDVEQSLASTPPPRILEMDLPDYKVRTVIRDFPVDWTILMENIMDPDHGLFAHSALGFDFYTASNSAPQNLVEDFPAKGWKITSSVDAVYKLKSINANRRGQSLKADDATKQSIRKATTTFYAPNLISSCRRDVDTNETGFLTAFWICPVGTGRSRFMSASIAKAPFLPPRWVFHVQLNNFLDQDTHLLATTQKHVLKAEAQQYETGTGARKNLFVYRSPTERLQTRLSNFFDATLAKVPNRKQTLQTMPFSSTPSRDYVLDRYTQHTKICPDSQKVVRNCKLVKTLAKLGGVGVLGWKLLLQKQYPIKVPLIVAMLVHWGADKLQNEFFFKYTEKYRDKDLKKISNVWMDPSMKTE